MEKYNCDPFVRFVLKQCVICVYCHVQLVIFDTLRFLPSPRLLVLPLTDSCGQFSGSGTDSCFYIFFYRFCVLFFFINLFVLFSLTFSGGFALISWPCTWETISSCVFVEPSPLGRLRFEPLNVCLAVCSASGEQSLWCLFFLHWSFLFLCFSCLALSMLTWTLFPAFFPPENLF